MTEGQPAPRKFSLEDVSISRKILAIVLTPIIFTLAFGVFLYSLAAKAEIEAEEEFHTRSVLSDSAAIHKSLIVSSASLYSFAKTRAEAQWAAYERSKADIRGNMRSLLDATADYPAEYSAAKELELSVIKLARIMNRASEVYKIGGTDIAPLFVMQLRLDVEDGLRSAVAASEKLKNLVVKRKKVGPNSHFYRMALNTALLVGMGVNVLVGALLARIVIRQISSRLDHISNETKMVRDGQALPPSLSGDDEIGRLDAFIHEMVHDLNETHRREQAIVETAADGIIISDRSGKILRVNPAAESIWQRAKDDFQQVSVYDLVAPEEREGLRLRLDEGTESDNNVVFDAIGIASSGVRLNLLWSVSRELDSDRFCWVIHDITERKEAELLLQQSEERLRTIMLTMPVGLMVCDSEGIVELCNPVLARMIGLESESTVAKKFSEFLPELVLQERPEQRNSLVQLICSSGPALAVEVQISNTVVRGNPKILLIIQDVSEREALERMKRDFVAMISHDLRSPLTSLQCTLWLFESGGYGAINERGISALSKSDREIARLIRLINTLLDYEKMESGQFELNPGESRTEQLVLHAVDAVELLAKKRSVQLVHEGTHASVVVDQDKILQVLINLLSNAIKYSEGDSVVVLRTSISEKDELVRFDVIDSGVGISAEHQASIFEKYKQVSDVQGTHKQGTGLGLPIAKLIVEQHGGQIGVDSSPGSGSTFWFTVPLLRTSVTVAK